MQITINQQEIEEAIRKHILSQISLRDNMKVEIDMAATRGPAGFTATINIVPNDAPERDKETSVTEDAEKASSGPLGIKEKISDARESTDDQPEEAEKPKPKRKSPVKKADKPKAEPETEETEEPAEAEETEEPELAEDTKPEASEEPDQAEEAPAARKGPSIFANLKKPSNKTDDE